MSAPPVGHAGAWELAAPYAASALGALVVAVALFFVAGFGELLVSPIFALLALGVVLMALWGHRRVFQGPSQGFGPVLLRGLAWGGAAGVLFLLGVGLVLSTPALLLAGAVGFAAFRVHGRWLKAGFAGLALGFGALVFAKGGFEPGPWLVYGAPVAALVGAVVGFVAATAGWVCLRAMGVRRPAEPPQMLL